MALSFQEYGALISAYISPWYIPILLLIALGGCIYQKSFLGWFNIAKCIHSIVRRTVCCEHHKIREDLLQIYITPSAPSIVIPDPPVATMPSSTPSTPAITSATIASVTQEVVQSVVTAFANVQLSVTSVFSMVVSAGKSAENAVDKLGSLTSAQKQQVV
jgi:hypothetical protein